MNTFLSKLNTYKSTPTGNYLIDTLEGICLERQKLYNILEETGNFNLRHFSSKWEDHLKTEIKRNNLGTYNELLSDNLAGTLRARRTDHIAHWLMSLYNCRDYNSRCDFIRWEIQWFALRYHVMTMPDKDQFLVDNNFLLELVPSHEKEILREQLTSCGKTGEIEFDSLRYFKINFTKVPILLKTRHVFLHRGIAYVPENAIKYYILCELKSQFSQQLYNNYEMFPTLVDDRIKNFLESLTFAHKTSQKEIEVTLENLDAIATEHFPICMQAIHNRLREAHHLKYDCKMQYGVFLKNIGLPYEDAMELWKSEFTQKISEGLYSKKYAYLFKHQYGKVGGKINYQPYSCRRIMSNCPGPTQFHGCPFKYWQIDKLKEKLQNDGLEASKISDIEDLVHKKQYQLACTKHFAFTRKIYYNMGIIENPNQYCKSSFDIEKGLENYFNSICDTL